jgi:Fe-S-cluster-containing dehydrogenase component
MSLVQISNAKKNRLPLDQLGQTPEFQGWADGVESQELDSNSRRDILKIMAAGAGLAGMVSCRRPQQSIVSFSKGVEDLIPGKPLFYNTISNLGGVAQGLRIEANDGRPTKVEGNPVHPTAKGSASTYSQGSVLGLYDPDRCTFVMKDQAASSWDAFGVFAKDHFSKLGEGEGLAFVCERNAGDSYRAVVAAAQKKWPKALWLHWEALNNDNAVLGAQQATGTAAESFYAFDKAEVVVSLDNDFLGVDATTVLPTKLFSQKRKVSKPGDTMNRLYVVEGHFSLTGGMADHRLRLKPSEIAGFAAEVLKLVSGSDEIKVEGEGRKKFASALAKDLKKNAGKSLVCAGPRQSPEVHALALAINQVLGNLGVTVNLLPALTPPQTESLKAFSEALKGGKLSTVVVLGGNPAYTMPSDVNFVDGAKKLKTLIHLGIEHDETAALAHWCLPQAHYLESWGDGRSIDGTASIQQPVIAPLYGGKTPSELLAELAGLETKTGYDLVKNFWTAGFAGEKEKVWKKSLHDGMIEGTAFAPLKLTVDVKKVEAQAVASPTSEAEVIFLPANGVYDGRFANNAWLVELPDPMTKVVWDNCVTMSSKTAESLKVNMGFIAEQGNMVSLSVGGATIDAAVVVVPGHADGVFGITLGYGREHVGRVGKGAGFNAYKLRATTGMGFAPVKVTKSTKNYLLVRTQDDPAGDTQNDRPIVREASLEDFSKEPAFAQKVPGPALESLFPDWQYDKGNQWGMTIDLNQCTGCNACLVACFSENNIAMVGKKFVAMGREMHWIRLDRYYSGDADEATVAVQPLNCQQCENAPCESVCPVAATVHSPEGLNDMAYNRCIGTRYCMNNCPYKVRKFNYLNWNKGKTELENLGSNPDVSTRMRGVMEKCTYCTQRISEGKINAKIDPAGRRAVRDGEIKTACQQTCPADAISFGNINDPNSEVAKQKASPRNYALLAELNIRPRTTYLAKLRNTNPDLAVAKKAPAAH